MTTDYRTDSGLTLLQSHKKQLEEKFAPFRSYRDDTGYWPQLLRRRAAVNLQPELAQYGQGIDIQAADLETEAILRKQILQLNKPKIDVIPQESGVHAKEDAEDCRIWFASWNAEFDKGQIVSDTISEEQVTKGVSVWRVRHRMPGEPDGPEQGDDEDAVSYAERYLKSRDEHFKELPLDTFTLHHIPTGSVMWTPLHDPSVVIEDTLIPYLEWKRLKNRAGKYLTWGQANNLAFLGDAEQGVEQGTESSDSQNRKIHLITHAYRVPGTKDDQWRICEYVSLDGGNLEDAEAKDEYDSPFGCPYEIVPSGEEMPSETDPHLRFRPALYGNYVNIGEDNYWRTLLGAVTRRAVGDERIYVKLGNLTPQQAGALEGIGLPVEGVGAERRLMFKRPDPGSGEIIVAPELAPVPSEIPDSLHLILQRLADDREKLQTNRFLTGNATSQEVSQGTGTAIVGQTQQAALPFSASLAHQETFWKNVHRKQQRALVYWDRGSEGRTRKQYSVHTTGQESVLKGSVEPGSVITVDAGKMGRKLEIIINISRLTDAERAQRDAASFQKKDRGLITLPQHLEEIGFDDAQKQVNELNKERHLVEAQMQFAPIEQKEREVLYSALSGLNIAALTGGMMPGQQQGAMAPTPSPGAPPAPITPQQPEIAPAPVGGTMGQEAMAV